MASPTEICNMALSHISSKEIADYTLTQSEEAKVCRIYYPVALQATLRDFFWPFATRTKALALVMENPTTEWPYSYRYPTDCVDIKRILSGNRNDTRKSRVSFKISNDDTGLIILTDMAEAYAEYTVNTVSTERFPADFLMALSYRLASYIAPRLTGGDPNKLQDRCFQLYRLELSRAKANALIEDQPDEPPASEFEMARL